ncbi:transcription factor bHLH25-like isoform X2 [Andrographis paniculata]|uniref:transcription factor bHLH25-like isoform X2 n=1 Tax=Andrographis paniculata TaxID=175694 RepID=UPI0021E8FBBB|nr:transcription factor bHLH25-like isoform X2 [Andrographis paniculata]
MTTNSLLMDPFDQEDLSAIFRQRIHNFIAPSSSVPFTNISCFTSLPPSTIEQPRFQSLGLAKTIKSDHNPIANCQVVSSHRSAPTTKKKSPRRIRAASQTYDHIMAERRRREQLSQLFISLVALVPGLKKMDKGSILEDTIKYIKHLQKTVQKLEKFVTKTTVIVNKSLVVVAEDGTMWDEPRHHLRQSLSEVTAKMRDNYILVRVNCEKHKGILAGLLRKVESLNMNIINANTILLGNVAMDITVVAKLEKGFVTTEKEVVAMVKEVLRLPPLIAAGD